MPEGLFFVWKNYQRRAEVLAPLLGTDLLSISHIFGSRYLRPLDYLIKLVASLHALWKQNPRFVIAQSPPLFSALPALITRTPYVLDAHNPVFQAIQGKISWGSLPLSEKIVKNAQAMIVHNHGILRLARQIYPETIFFNIPDPLDLISSTSNARLSNQILAICSFDPDEPVEVLIKSIQELPDYTFVVTANPLKLPPNLRSILEQLPNVKLTGFLPTKEYHSILRTSLAALVLTNQDLTQPSGACEALSSDTQLIVSQTSLTTELFGEWATLVENTAPSIVEAIRSLQPRDIDLSVYRDSWNQLVHREISNLKKFLA